MKPKPKARKRSPARKCKYNLLGGFNPYDQAGKDYIYDHAQGMKAVNFIQNELSFTKGVWKGKPFKLHKWQMQFVLCLFGWIHIETGYRRFRRAFLYIPRKNGKALAVDTPIPTPSGMVNMGDLQVGDYVFDENSNPTEIIAATKVMSDHECYSVKFSDGSEIVADKDHLWKTHTKKPWDRDGVYTTEEVGKTIMAGKDRNHRLDVPPAVEMSDKTYTVNPYILGAWLGDGTTMDAQITVGYGDLEIIDYLSEFESINEYSDHNGCKQLRLGKVDKSTVCRRGHLKATFWKKPHCRECENMVRRAKYNGEPIPPMLIKSLKEHLTELDLIGNKHIPESYMSGSYQQRLELLRGLLDTDGTISKAGRVSFTNSNKCLAYQSAELCRSLGYKTTVTSKIPTLNGVNHRRSYLVNFTPLGGPKVFKLCRKAQRQRGEANTKTRSKTKHIVSVENVDSVPVRCIQVEAKSHMYLAGDGYTPTHNSELVAAVANYILHCSPDEPDNELYIAAKNSHQASTLYNMARLMNEQNESLDSEVEYNKTFKTTKLIHDETILKVLSADGESVHSTSPGLGVVDELHTQHNDVLIEAITTGMGARQQPLVIFVSTAGIAGDTICNQEVELAREIRAGITKMPTYMPVLFEIEPGENWESRRVWKRVNPSYPEHPSKAYLEEAFLLAKRLKSKEISFRKLHLNEQVSGLDAWLDMNDWEKGKQKFTEEQLSDQRCFVGIDLTSKVDIGAVVYYFPDLEYAKLVAYLPRKAIRYGAKENVNKYLAWHESGLIKIAGEKRLDYDVLLEDIVKANDDYDIIEIAYDPWNANQLSNDMENDGFEIVEFRQGMRSYNEPSKEFEAKVAEGTLKHWSPVLDWMAGNTFVKIDENENIRPIKASPDSTRKIDGIAALIMAIGLFLVYDQEGQESMYNNQGIRSV